MDLFSHSETTESPSRPSFVPLAERLRPQTLADFVGQEKYAHPDRPLIKNLKKTGFLPNIIIWGPPGTGKTTFARLLSHEAKARFISCNAIETGAKDLRDMGNAAHHHRLQFQEKTILFVDEIHRLNKSQQDVLLPFTEKGDLVLIGATTENPGYELNSALLSRSQVLHFTSLTPGHLRILLDRALKLLGVDNSQLLTEDAITNLLSSVDGDGRRLLGIVDVLSHLYSESAQEFPYGWEQLSHLEVFQTVRYDKNKDEHYNTISAFIKSVRGSDPDAAVYYLARMLEGGEDPVFIARRLVILASEDIGNADPRALPLAVAGLQAVELIGLPEARISLSQVTTYLASAPKSNRSYLAINEAMDTVKKTGTLPIPLGLRSAQTQFAKDLGYGRDYKYSHDYARGFADQQFLPEALKGQRFYEPSEHGFEKNIKSYLEWLRGKKD